MVVVVVNVMNVVVRWGRYMRSMSAFVQNGAGQSCECCEQEKDEDEDYKVEICCKVLSVLVEVLVKVWLSLGRFGRCFRALCAAATRETRAEGGGRARGAEMENGLGRGRHVCSWGVERCEGGWDGL